MTTAAGAGSAAETHHPDVSAEFQRESPPPGGGYRQRLAVASAWSALGSVFGLVTGPVIAVVLVRAMSHRAFGDLVVAGGTAGLLAVLFSAGLGVAVVQVSVSERARRGDEGLEAVVSTALRLTIVCTGAALPVVVALRFVFQSSSALAGAAAPFTALWPVVILAPMTGLTTGLAKALHRPRSLAIATAISSLTGGGAVIGLVIATHHPSSTSVAGARTLAALVMASMLVPVLAGARRRRCHRVGSAPARLLITYGFPILLGAVFAGALAELDSVLLGAFHGSRVVGIYAPAAATAAAVVTLPGMIGGFYFPLTTDLAAREDRAGVSGLYHWATRWSIAFFAPALAVMWVCPAAFLRSVFGSGFGSMAGPLRILGIGVAIQLLTGFNGLTLDAYGLPATVAARQAASLGVTLVACAILIPSFGADGAAVAVTVGFATANVLCSGLLWRKFHVGPLDRRLAVVIGGLVAGILASSLAEHRIASDLGRVLLTLGLTGLVTIGTTVVVSGPEERSAIARRVRSRP